MMHPMRQVIRIRPGRVLDELFSSWPQVAKSRLIFLPSLDSQLLLAITSKLLVLSSQSSPLRP